MNVNPDATVLWQIGGFAINLTIVYTWAVMALLTVGAWAITRRLSTGDELSRWQSLVEVLVSGMRDQIREVGRRDPGPFLPFVGTLFVFIAASNLLAVIPGFVPPTASLSTTTALALAVFLAVPLFGIREEGLRTYLSHYVRPTWLMLPFNVMGEISRTLALAVRLYGNIMSGALIVAILLTLAPFFFPILMQLLGLLTGLIQAYIFAVLAMVYIASASSVRAGTGKPGDARPETRD